MQFSFLYCDARKCTRMCDPEMLCACDKNVCTHDCSPECFRKTVAKCSSAIFQTVGDLTFQCKLDLAQRQRVFEKGFFKTGTYL